MRTLSIDIESFSSANLTASGVYKYAEAPDFATRLFGYSIDHQPPEVIDLKHGEVIPEEALCALLNPEITKSAFNANFERVCLFAYLRKHYPRLLASGFLSASSWRCSMVVCAYLGLPQSLEAAARVLGLEAQKDNTGKRLIRKFCTLQRPRSQADSLQGVDPDWNKIIEYCRQDVAVEIAIQQRLSTYEIPDSEWETYILDQKINDTDIMLDLPLVDQAIACDQKHREKLCSALKHSRGWIIPTRLSSLKHG